MKTEEMMDDSEESTTPLDDIISRIDEYIKNPKLVTPDTLTQLKSDIEDLKTVVDGEDDMEGEECPSPNRGKHSGLAVIIQMGKGMKKEGGKNA